MTDGEMRLDRRQLLGGAVAVGGLALGGCAGLPSSALGAASAAAPAMGWRKLPTEPFRGKQDDIHFVDFDHGFYGNGEGKLYGTRDGGASWQKLWERHGTFIRALGFIDQRTGFIGNVGTGYYPGVEDDTLLYRTDDGGVTLTPVRVAGSEALRGICAIDILPVRRVYQGELAASHVVRAGGRVGGPGGILVSKDGGRNWQIDTLGGQAAMILDIHFLDERNGFVAAATSANIAEARALILRTRDGGRSWHPVYTGTRTAENIWKMAWPSARVGYATVQSYDPAPTNTQRLVVKTTDGGATWREMPLATGPGLQEFGIGFADERTGWVGTRAGGFATLDGGASWTRTDFGAAVNKIRILHAGGRHRAFAIGSEVHRLDW